MTAGGFTEEARDDCMEFLTRHARHQLETFRPTIAQAFRTGALSDANAPTYWQVSNGDRLAVVEGWRSQAGGALRYKLRSGRVITEHIAVEIPEDDIRRQLDGALFPGVAPEKKLNTFVDAFKELVGNLQPSAFEVLYEVPGDPTLVVANLAVSAIAKVSEDVHRIFDQAESAKIIASFSGTEENSDGLTVLIRQRVRVEG